MKYLVSLQECKTQLRHCRESQDLTIKDLSNALKVQEALYMTLKQEEEVSTLKRQSI